MCGICDIQNEAPLELFTDEDYNRIIRGIAIGLISTTNLDYNTYSLIARKLSEGVFKGYGKDLHDVMRGTVDYDMLFDLRQNVYIFSGAKTYQQTREIEAKLKELTGALTKEDKINSYAEFHKQAKEILVTYNENYLRTEYNTAIGQSQNASKWIEFERDKHIFPNLTYHTVGDDRVSDICKPLDGITKPVGDSFWKTYAPKNHWGCRCLLLQNDSDAKITDTKDFKHPEKIPDIFMFNPGIERIVFSPKHPYFDVAPKDKKNAKNNWGLPMHL